MSMKTKIPSIRTPEQKELEKKTIELSALEEELTQRELELATLIRELKNFELKYVRTVGVCLAELDELEAQIAEIISRSKPMNKRAHEEASRRRAQAEASSHATAFTRAQSYQEIPTPSDDLKKLYRQVAKMIHPDLTTDEKVRLLRQQMMKEANRAYEDGNEEKLRSILDQWESSPEAVAGEGAGAELVRIIRKIAQVQGRLSSIATEMHDLTNSDLYQLKIQVEGAEKSGRDLLSEMAAANRIKIDVARTRLNDIKINDDRRK